MALNELRKTRSSLAAITNDHLERAGHSERIDHRSNKERGIDREPMRHMSVAVCSMERRGIRTQMGEYNREIIIRNRAKDEAEGIFRDLEAEEIARKNNTRSMQQVLMDNLDKELVLMGNDWAEKRKRKGKVIMLRREIKSIEESLRIKHTKDGAVRRRLIEKVAKLKDELEQNLHPNKVE